jgi:hypothetical protein
VTRTVLSAVGRQTSDRLEWEEKKLYFAAALEARVVSIPLEEHDV